MCLQVGPFCPMVSVLHRVSLDEFELGYSRRGWQHEAAGPTGRMHRDTRIMPRLSDSERVALRTQSGPGSGLALFSTLFCPVLRIDSHLFQVLLLRRLHLPPVSRPPLWSVQQSWGVGQAGFCFGECGSTDLLRGWGGFRRMFSFEIWISWHPTCMTRGGLKQWQEVCHCTVGRRWLWTPHWCRRTTVTERPHLERRMLTERHRWWLGAARKEPVLSWWAPEAEPSWWCWQGGWRPVVGGNRTFLRLLAVARARSESVLMQHKFGMRWGGMLGCAAARAFNLCSDVLGKKKGILQP